MLDLGRGRAAPRAFEMAGVRAADMEFLQIYDGFTHLVLLQLERLGLAERGGAATLVKDGALELGGPLPFNTAGGMLSPGHCWGVNLGAKAVRQLRHDSGARSSSIRSWDSSRATATSATAASRPGEGEDIPSTEKQLPRPTELDLESSGPLPTSPTSSSVMSASTSITCRLYCPRCFSGRQHFQRVSGGGFVYGYTVSHYSAEQLWRDQIPWVTVVVERDEGPRVVGTVRGIALDEVVLGRRVKVVTERINDDTTSLSVEPEASADE